MRFRPRYTIGTLLVVVVLVALAVGYFLNLQRLREVERELVVLRQEAGHLQIDDRTKIHAVAVPTDEPDTWKWRLFLPKGHRYEWKAAASQIPRDTVPKGGWGGVSNAPYWEQDNEALVTVKLNKKDNGSAHMTVESRIATGPNQMYGMQMPISAEELEWMRTIGHSDGRVLGEYETAIVDPAGPIILLQRRACELQPDGVYRPSENPRPGFMVWLEKW